MWKTAAGLALHGETTSLEMKCQQELVIFPGRNRTCEPPGNVSQGEATEKASCTQGQGRRMFNHESSRSSKGHRDKSGGQLDDSMLMNPLRGAADASPVPLLLVFRPNRAGGSNRDAAEQRHLSPNAPYLASPGLQVARQRPDLGLRLEPRMVSLEHDVTRERPRPLFWTHLTGCIDRVPRWKRAM